MSISVGEIAERFPTFSETRIESEIAEAEGEVGSLVEGAELDQSVVDSLVRLKACANLEADLPQSESFQGLSVSRGDGSNSYRVRFWRKLNTFVSVEKEPLP